MTILEQIISAEPVTNFRRVARHEAFVILPDLNMVQQIRVVTLDENDVPIHERIARDNTLNPVQKQNALMRYQDQIITRQTAGAFVDPATGEVVAEAAGGAVPQRDYFQAITLGNLKAKGMSVTDDTPIAQLLYTLIGNEISEIDIRAEL